MCVHSCITEFVTLHSGNVIHILYSLCIVLLYGSERRKTWQSSWIFRSMCLRIFVLVKKLQLVIIHNAR